MDSADSPALNKIIFDDQNHERRSWKFCNKITLPRSEVVFFTQMVAVMLIIVISSVKLGFYSNKCEDKNIWIILLSSTVGYILPNPHL